MAEQIPTLPDMSDQAVQMPGNVLDQAYYLFLSLLLKVVVEQRRQLTMVTSAVIPTTADIPVNESRVWRNTAAGTVRLYTNSNGTLVSVLLS